MQCTVCSNEFESRRTDAKYCSSSCRKKASRVTDNVTDNPNDVTDKLSVTNDIFETLEKIRIKYNGEVTKEILTAETGMNYTFVPSWLKNKLTLDDLSLLRNF